MSLQDELLAAGIKQPYLVIPACYVYEVPIEYICVVLMKESAGGLNVYGHDRDACFTHITPGSISVTRENYAEYLACVAAGGKRNGVGPMQLTHWSLQELADKRGGCWDPAINIWTGVEFFKQKLTQSGGDPWGAFKRYNGSAAYADDAMSDLPYWQEIVRNAPMATSQNGWPASADRAAIGVVYFERRGIAFPGGVKGGDVHKVLGYVAEEFGKRVEALFTPGCWGHAFRVISGSSFISNHGSGTAIDVNAPRHPFGVRGTFTLGQVAQIRSILSVTGTAVRWGGDYTRPDEMHFEINTTPAGVAEAARRVDAFYQPPTPAPGPVEFTNTTVLKEGMTGPLVTELQRVLNRWYPSMTSLVQDGIYGPKTTDRVRYFQSRAGLVADGIAGPRTLGALGFI